MGISIRLNIKNNYYFLQKTSKKFGGFIFLYYLCIRNKKQLKYITYGEDL